MYLFIYLFIQLFLNMFCKSVCTNSLHQEAWVLGLTYKFQKKGLMIVPGLMALNLGC